MLMNFPAANSGFESHMMALTSSLPQEAFVPLVVVIQDLIRDSGMEDPKSRVGKPAVAIKLASRAPDVYHIFGVPGFKDYVKMAILRGVIKQYDHQTIGLL